MNHAARFAAIAAGVCIGVVGAAPTEAQVVRGFLLDAVSDAPISAGIVSLLDSDGQRVVSASADGRGVFVLRAPSPGEYRLMGERIGYAAATSSPIPIPADNYVQVVFRLSIQPAVLDPITVVAPSGSRLTPGQIVNAERQDRGRGVFLTRDDVLARSTQDVRDAIRGVEGIRVGMGRGGIGCGLGRSRGSGIELWDGMCLISSMGWGCMKLVINEQPLTSWGDQTRWERTALLPRPEGVAAMEVYRTYQEVPDRLKWVAWPIEQVEPCGVVAIWTLAAW